MPTLLDLVTPRLGGGQLDPAVRALLSAVTTQSATLPATQQVVGRAPGAQAWPVVRQLFPVPSFDAPPFPGEVEIDARSLGESGWEVGIALPAMDIGVPGLDAGHLQTLGDGRQAVRKIDGTVSLQVPAVRVAVRAPGGADAKISMPDAAASVVPDIVALTGSFGITVGQVRIGDAGTQLSGLALHLPALPRLPTGPVAVPTTIRAGGGIFARAGPVQLAASPAACAASVTVVIDQPEARTLSDIAPTTVVVDLALEGTTMPLPGGERIGAAATGGGPVALQATISLASNAASVRAALTGNGNDRGVARLSSADGGTAIGALTIAAALGPYLGDEGPEGAALAVLLGAAGGALAGDTPELELVLHSVNVGATWSDDPPPIEQLDIRVDYECQVPFALATGGVGARTKPGHPYRARHRNVRVVAGSAPLLSWRGATSTIVSPGEWAVDGVPEELLRVADVVTRKGSLDLELDLRLALELGPVTLDRSVWLVSLGNGSPRLRPSAFGVSIVVPGAIDGHGELRFRESRVDAALAIKLPAIGVGGRGALAVASGAAPGSRDMIMVAAEVDLPTPIPFANSGLGLYSVGGVLAHNAEPIIPGGDPIEAALGWNPRKPDAWEPGRQQWLGFSARIGTVPDFGFALMGDCIIVVGLPDPALLASLQADLLGGFTGSLKGVLALDSKRLLIAVKGHFEVPALLELTVPAGAIFPFDDVSAWQARLGGDRTPERGEPVTALVLPDLLRLEAWMFLMAFGDASTTVGAALADGAGIQVHGMSVAFGAGFDVEWEAGPFSFAAGGVILAVLTHRPAPPGEESPWVLAGRAALHGSVDLGPVSIGASARLEAFVDPSAEVVYGDAHACAKVDLWFTELEGCVHVEIGDRPLMPAPAPSSPLQNLKLTDRVGHVVATAARDQNSAPMVWPDTVPVLVFDTWVAMSPALDGIGTVIGDSLPEGDGWIGTADLSYRFDLVQVKVVEEGSVPREIGTAWNAAWQLPLVDDVFGAGEPPARARSLALNVLDLHHWLQSAISLPENAPGGPIGILGRLCTDVPQPQRWWFPGHGATLPPAGPTQLHAVPVGAQRSQLGDPTTVTVFIEDPEFGEFAPDDSRSPAIADFYAWSHRPAGVEPLFEPIEVDGLVVTGVCWLPLRRRSDMRTTLLLRFDQPVRDVTLDILTPIQESAAVVADGWQRENLGGVGPWTLDAWHSPPGVPLTDIVVRPQNDQQIGLLSISAMSERAINRRDALEQSRRKTHDALEGAATTKKTPRRLMQPGLDHRIEVTVDWQSRGSMYQASSGTFVDNFWFTTAAGGDRPDPPPHPAGPLHPLSIFQLSATALELFAESELAGADLGRYVGGFLPPPGTAHWFHDDPVQIMFLVDHLTELAELYDSQLTLTARRTDAAPGTPPADPAPRAIPVPTPTDPGLMVDPLVITALTWLDQQRFVFAASQEQPDGCRLRKPGAAAPIGLDLEPDAAYRMTLTVDRTDGIVAVGNGPVIAEATFTTSRYADVPSMFLELGFVPAGAAAPPEPAVFPLPQSATPPGPGSDYEVAIRSLELDGYRSGARGGCAVLWKQQGADWLFAGVLIECPEPIERPGRVAVGPVHVGDVEVQPIWDARRTRLLLLVPPAPQGSAVSVRLDVTHTPPGGQPVHEPFTATLNPYRPEEGGPP